ncbi:MAG: HDOD domain-containing protein [Candidatus Accumulibacter sp.]|uniref:GGDEF domain-containing response regulator n=1 Tax=Candidatus Accumulibacter TaxID=327159 RepID=UPI00208B81F5|nr:diguanylate cyclase [Accumulibacter sp.]MBK8117236.1 HDOD domain-containing protein [Accumulibacter sp.]MBK8386643.1 HDOD domain-containing protein [Accumulibacter sp.]MBK8579644.1 HDOD domain-containing protein [Candidatus Accumulibacter propinquus]
MIKFVDPSRYHSMKATGKLPSPKGVAFSIIKLLQKDDFRVSDLVQLVQSDPAIAGRLLKFANAAAFGRARPIVSLQRAIVALGSFRVRDLVIGLSVMHSHTSGQCPAFDYGAFWGHSLATGIACQELAHFAQISSEELFTIGLLARVGELAMASLYPEEYAVVLLKARETQQDLAALERQRFDMDHNQLGATMLGEWGLPEMLIQAAYHHEQPDLAGFRDGSRVLTLTHSLNFARSLAEVCMADEESRWSLLPGLLTRAARLGISGDALNDMVDRMARRWRDWGAMLQVRTQEIPPFAEILAASPPSRRVSSVSPEQNGKDAAPRLRVQLLGIPLAELPALIRQIESLGHQPVLVDSTPEGLKQALREPAQIVIADMAMPGLKPAAFCRILRQTPAGKETYALLLASPESEEHILEAIDAGADDVLVKPLNIQTLRVRLNTATRMLRLREEIQRERRGIMRSTDEFAVAHKRLLQEALTDPLTQLPNRRHGLDFLASEWAFAQSNALPMACLLLDIDHFKRINDTYGHAAGDAVLRQLAELLKRASRAEDLVFRYGGEEFAAVLPNATARAAVQIAERIRSVVEKYSFLWEGQTIPVTLSIGVASLHGAEMDSQALIQASDAALFEAKRNGRNRVAVAA